MRLEVTRRAELAVQAVAALSPEDTRLKAPQLAEALDSSAGFVAQVLGPLVKAGWVRSTPGPSGGYSLTEAATEASVLDVIEAVDGPTSSGRCVADDRPCNVRRTCALHEAWSRARVTLVTALAATPAIEPTRSASPDAGATVR